MKVILVIERHGAQNGAKNLLLCDVRFVGDSGNNGGHIKAPFARRGSEGRAPSIRISAPSLRAVSTMLSTNSRWRKTGAGAELRAGGVGQIHLQRLRSFYDHRNYFVVDLAFHK